LGAFISPIKLPYPDINLADSKGVISKDNNGLLSTAEIATLQLELKYLSHLTDDDKYWDAAEHVMEVIRGQLTHLSSPLPPVFIRVDNGRFVPSYIRVGSRGDSYYEYLLKQYLQTSEPVYREITMKQQVVLISTLYKELLQTESCTRLKSSLRKVELMVVLWCGENIQNKTILFALLEDFSFLVLQRVKGLFHQMSLLSVKVNFEIGEMALG